MVRTLFPLWFTKTKAILVKFRNKQMKRMLNPLMPVVGISTTSFSNFYKL